AALRQITQMTGLIEIMQNDLRLEGNTPNPAVVTVDLCAAVIAAIRRHEHEDRSRFTLDRPREPIRVRGDPDRIAQILVNLLNNAVKYSPAGAPIDVAA